MRIECDHCGASWIYDNDEKFDNIICPVCGRIIHIQNSVYDMKYPDNFVSYENGVRVSNDEINDCIKEMIEKLKHEDGDNDCDMWMSGDTLIFVHHNAKENMYYVIVSRGYAEAYISE